MTPERISRSVVLASGGRTRSCGARRTSPSRSSGAGRRRPAFRAGRHLKHQGARFKPSYVLRGYAASRLTPAAAVGHIPSAYARFGLRGKITAINAAADTSSMIEASLAGLSEELAALEAEERQVSAERRRLHQQIDGGFATEMTRARAGGVAAPTRAAPPDRFATRQPWPPRRPAANIWRARSGEDLAGVRLAILARS